MKPTTRQEVRAIVDEAKRAGKPITANIIWGLISREMPYQNVLTLLSLMVRANQLNLTPGVATGAMGKPAGTYEPGAKPVTSERGAQQEYYPRMMGFREHARLVEARKDAREWLEQRSAA